MNMVWQILLGACLLYCTQDASAQTITVTSTSEAEVSLPCVITNGTALAVWMDPTDPTQAIYSVLLGGSVFDDRNSSKYDNFEPSFSLVIKPVQDTDGGIYSCLVLSMGTVNGTTHILEVEVPGTISIRDENDAEIASPLDVTVGEPYPITCQVIGARSSNDLALTWNPSSGAITGTNPISDGETLIDYSSTIEYQPARCHTRITCSLGQFESQLGQVTDSVTLNVRYRPECTLTYSSPGDDCTQVELTCNCDANPGPEIYEFEQAFGGFNGTISGNTATANVEEDSDTVEFTCRARNTIDGTSGFGVTAQLDYTCPSRSAAPATDSSATTDRTTQRPGSTASATDSTTTTDQIATCLESQSINPALIIGWVLAALLAITLIVLAFMYKRNIKAAPNSEGTRERTADHHQLETGFDGPAHMDLKERGEVETSDRPGQIPEKNVSIVSDLPGHGLIAYQKVNVTRNSQEGEMVKKLLRDNASIASLKVWSSEIQSVLKLPNHPNIVNIIGWCNSERLTFRSDIFSNKVPSFLLTEFVNGGSLLQHLSENFSTYRTHQYGNIKRKKFKVQERGDLELLPTYALDVSRGMRFLSINEFVHPGLRAQKVLVDLTGRCKLYDFLSKERSKEVTSFRWAESVPYQWMSPEFLLLGKLSPACDVWSFGVLLWEIFSFGAEPYSSQGRDAVESSLRELGRLTMPTNCPGAIWSLMIQCWTQDPDERPTYDEIASKLSMMCNDDKEYAEISSG